MFAPGDELGDYVIERRLGAGGFGEVFLAVERSLKRRVALKFVRPAFAADAGFVERFEREADAMALVEHPNVVPIYARREEDGVRYLAMRYVAGGSLDAYLAGHPRLTDVVELLAGVAEGLDHCHARGVVHRDLKPANVLVDADRGCGLLADFGIADAEDFSTMTAPGNLLGTRAYMAPETLMGGEATPASDRWALAAIAYRAATGTLPHGRTDPPGAPPVRPSVRDDRLGPAVDRVLLRALSADPARRHHDARAFIAELREALEPPTHRSTTPPPALPAARKRLARRLWSVAGAAVVLLPMAAYGVATLADRTAADCHPAYAGACLKPDAGDYDCRSGGGDGPNYVTHSVKVVGEDVFGLDGNGDRIAC